MNYVSPQGARAGYSDAEWDARVDLAAAHRLAYKHGFSEGIFNHLTARVPGKPDRYYQIPFGTHWSEVTASCFMEVGYDGELKSGEGLIEQSCYAIHAPIHRLAEHAEAVFHTHMPYASALTRLEDMRIKPIGQTEVLMMTKVAYDTDYQGPACHASEGERLVGALGDKKVLFMANHGIATVGRTIAEAYDLLYYVERVSQVQIMAMWSGQQLKYLPAEVIEATMAMAREQRGYGGVPNSTRHFEALKRILDRESPDYRD